MSLAARRAAARWKCTEGDPGAAHDCPEDETRCGGVGTTGAGAVSELRYRSAAGLARYGVATGRRAGGCRGTSAGPSCGGPPGAEPGFGVLPGGAPGGPSSWADRSRPRAPGFGVGSGTTGDSGRAPPGGAARRRRGRARVVEHIRPSGGRPRRGQGPLGSRRRGPRATTGARL